MNSRATEEYLEALYKLSEAGPVRQARLAEHLGLSQAATAEMVKKLILAKLAKRDKTGSIGLTKSGTKAALETVRKHRLSERFLTDILGLPWEKAHEEACKLEHVLSPEVEDGLDRLLNNPKSCPHGYPIPDKEGVITTLPTRPLSDLGPDEKAVIALVSEDDPEMLKYLATLGLMPDVEIVVEEIGPFRGPLLIQVGAARYALGRDLASKIMVRESA
ncbi:MAG: metal-dependent transcriptional regulator [Actinomycetota bacterium]|nr:metal-dependent transcriptional regulator [Actinomycetota bacterium]